MDGAGLPARLRPRFGGCERGRSVPLAAAAVRARASAFLAAVCASGAASRPELSPPLYGSVIFTRACLRLRLPMRAVAGGSGDDVVLDRGLFCRRVAPIRLAVLVHMLARSLGGIASFSGSGLPEERELRTMAVRCASTTRRLWTVPTDDETPSFRNSWETVITFSRIEAVVALASLCAAGEPSRVGGVVLGITASTAPICWSLCPKKWATAATCLHS